MPVKYVSKDKNDNWKISITKSGKAIRVFATQKEAIDFVSNQKNTEGIMVKRKSGWESAFFVKKEEKNLISKTSISKTSKKKNQKINLSFDNTLEKTPEVKKEKFNWKVLLISLGFVVFAVGVCFLLGFFLRIN